MCCGCNLYDYDLGHQRCGVELRVIENWLSMGQEKHETNETIRTKITNESNVYERHRQFRHQVSLCNIVADLINLSLSITPVCKNANQTNLIPLFNLLIVSPHAIYLLISSPVFLSVCV